MMIIMVLDWDEPRPNLTPEIMAVLRDRFGLEPEAEPRDLGGTFSLNVLVETRDGRSVARVYGAQTSAARLAEIQHVRRYLGAGGIPTSEQVLTVDGAPFVVVTGPPPAHRPVLLEVERYVEHDAYMGTWERLEIGLPYLGRAHTLLRSVRVSPAGRHPLIANHIEPDHALAGTREGVWRLRALDLSPEEQDLMSAYEDLAHLVDRAERGVVDDLPRQLVHGDFWDNNVLFRGDEVVLVADFDFLGERLRIDDLALTLFFVNSSIGGDRLSEERMRQLRQLVDAYDSGLAEPLSRAERRALPAVIARQPLWTIGRHVVDVPGVARARRLAGWRAVDVAWTLALMRDLTHWQEVFIGSLDERST